MLAWNSVGYKKQHKNEGRFSPAEQSALMCVLFYITQLIG